MKLAAKRFAAILVFFSLLPQFASAAEPGKKRASSSADQEGKSQVDSMTIWQARRAVVSALKSVMPKNEFKWGAGYKVKMRPESIHVDAARVECTAEVTTWGFNTEPDPHTESCDVDLKTVGVIGIKSYRRQYDLTQDGKRRFGESLLGNIAWSAPEQAQAFADALNRLSAAARGEDMEADQAGWVDFQQKAARWRALAAKPAISEEVRKHRLLAENAVKERQFDAAIEEYEAGLEIDPLWPEGHFNSALLSAELGYYSWAIRHMRCYLELVPEAPDAQSARDQIVIWLSKTEFKPDSSSDAARQPARRAAHPSSR
jgi:tetratricopeptide (TPR) repeat protein